MDNDSSVAEASLLDYAFIGKPQINLDAVTYLKLEIPCSPNIDTGKPAGNLLIQLNSVMNFYVYPINSNYVNSAAELDKGYSIDEIIIFDLFNTGNFYISKANIMNGIKSNSLPLYVHINNVWKSSPLTNTEYPHGFVYAIQIPFSDPFQADYTLHFKRHVSEFYDGWEIMIGHMFYVDSMKKFVISNDQSKNLSDKLSNDIEKLTKAIKKMKTTNLSPNKTKGHEAFSVLKGKGQSNAPIFHTDIILGEEESMSQFSICSHFSLKTQNVDIVSKDYVYANRPENTCICTHSALSKPDKASYCGFGLTPNQTICPYYKSSSVLRKKYTSKGKGSLSFDLYEHTDSKGNKVFNLVNSENDQVSYTLVPPVDAPYDQVVSEIDSVVNEVVSSCPEEVSSTLVSLEVPPSIETPVEKKSFILSLI